MNDCDLFVGSDWLRGDVGEYSEQMQAWLEIVQLSFEMKNLDQTREDLEQAGFTGVQLRDRNEWYQEEIKRELATLTDPGRTQLAEKIDKEAADHRFNSSSIKQLAVENGDLRPTHFMCHKPEV